MKKNVILTITLVFLVALGVALFIFKDNFHEAENNTYYLSSDKNTVITYDESFKESNTLFRGITVDKVDVIENEAKEYYKIKYNGNNYYVLSSNVTTEKGKIATEKELYVRTGATLYEDISSGKILGLVNKGDMLEVLDYYQLDEEGNALYYKVKSGELTGYVYSKYLVFNKEESLLNYDENGNYLVHKERGAGSLDYYPVQKVSFEDNVMPEKVYAFYLNGSKSVMDNVDKYIELAKSSKINAFVVDIKDNESPRYKSNVMKEYSITNYNKAELTTDEYKSVITKLKNEGFYVIGRITVFKDKYYAMDHPENAITNAKTGKLYLHSNTYWPSPYKRGVWEFNVELAKEAVKEMGFNEIQFDYVRFPDRTSVDEKNGTIDFLNAYKEEKAQAVQRFVMYACDELHRVNAYCSIDVFGESAHTYVTAYGQYWAAISNVADVISAMPYPDHFNTYEYGFTEPVYTVPYKLLKYWGEKYASKRQLEIETPAIARTWIQTYNVMSYKHAGGYTYGADKVEEQIRGLFEAGLDGGYMTWNSASSYEKYKSQINAYNKEY